MLEGGMKSLSARIGRVRTLSFLFLFRSKLDVLIDNKSLFDLLSPVCSPAGVREARGGWARVFPRVHAPSDRRSPPVETTTIYTYLFTRFVFVRIFSDTRRSHHRYLINCWM